jgi:hypothetical protein
METIINVENAKMWLKQTLNDPIIKNLLKNSNLTEIQFESLLIDLFAEELLNRRLIDKEKTCLRTNKTKLTRGSFNRTLSQARRNIIRSIYTVFLLGYAGIFDNPKLEPYIEVANKIKSHMEVRKNLLGGESEEFRKSAELIGRELEETIEKLAKKFSFSGET